MNKKNKKLMINSFKNKFHAANEMVQYSLRRAMALFLYLFLVKLSSWGLHPNNF